MGIAITTHTVRVSTRVGYQVHCAFCECDFVYRLDVTCSGEASHGQGAAPAVVRETQALAKKEAIKNLDSELRDPKLCGAVPCPQCACYQKYMFRRAGEIRYGGMGCLGGALLGGGLLVLIVGLLSWRTAKQTGTFWAVISVLGGLVLVAGTVVRVLAALMIANYNPNQQEPKHERKKNSSVASSPDEFDKEQLQEARVEYVAYAKHASETGGWPTEPADQLVLEWWVQPALLRDGGSFFIHLADGYRLVVDVPPDTESGSVFIPRRAEQPTGPVYVRVRELRIHADERRRRA
jgi:hypothetical protein